MSKLAEATQKNHIKRFRGSPKDKEHVYTNIYNTIKLPKISEKEKLLKIARVDKRGEGGVKLVRMFAILIWVMVP